jgi:cytochrome c peroxidase
MNRKYLVVITILLTGIIACKKGLIESSFAGFQQPSNFPAPAYHFASNEVTKAGFELGRKLFFDPLLSANNTISCGNCHIPTAAFSHNGHSVSHGIHDLLGKRNSPAIMNLAWSTSFMWDGGIFDLDLQPVAPITNHVELDETMENVLNKLRNDAKYPPMFGKAFGSAEISSSNFLKALSQFMLMCVSSNSKYDSVMRNQGKVFSPLEQQGYALVKQKCTSCHAEPLFTDNSFRNNGINPSILNDSGRYKVTLNPADKYKFKVPALRNLSYTAPYMHDGRFFTLEAVLDHYSDHVQPTENIDPLLQQGSVLGIPMNADEKLQVLAFLKTLDDKSFVTNPLLAEQ